MVIKAVYLDSFFIIPYLTVKIAVNTRILVKDKLDGIGQFTNEILKRVVLNHPEHEFYFIFDRPFDNKFIYAKNVTPVVLQPRAFHPLLFKFFFQTSLKNYLKRNNFDLFLSLDGNISKKSPCKVHNVIHDVNFITHPEYIEKKWRVYYESQFPIFAQQSNRLVTVSQFSKNEIVKHLKIDAASIDVVYNGVKDIFKSEEVSQESNEWLEHELQQHPFFLSVGTLIKRKNYPAIFKAFDLFKEKNKGSHKLVIVGRQYSWDNEVEKAYKNTNHKNDIVFTGRIDDDKLKSLYKNAIALLYLSHYEGFGIPIIEAMVSGCPVICNNNSALPEIAEKSALFVQGENFFEIVSAMVTMIEAPEERNRFVELGKKRAEYFNWDTSAKLYWESIESTMQIENK